METDGINAPADREEPGTERDAEQRFAVVYRGYDPQWTAMLADALRAEGLNCHHVGTQNPALANIGGFGCEQRLEVPADEVERARPLIEASVARSAAAAAGAPEVEPD